MGLSNDLITQFVKVTNDKKEKKKHKKTGEFKRKKLHIKALILKSASKI